MKDLLLIFVLIASTFAQEAYRAPYAADEAPKPYSFSYLAEGEEGTSSREETADGSGRVQGSYSLRDLEGNNRIVEYVADHDGFRATVRTNEPGTANQNPADVVIESSAPGADLGGGYAYSRPAPAAPAPRRPGPSGGGVTSGGVRYVLVPITDPRAEGYY